MSNWFWCPATRPEAAMRLYCVAHAGAGASTFATWGRAAPEWMEVAAVMLPGRETRMGEPLVADLALLAQALAARIRVEDERPYALFGHSMGARLAARCAALLEQGGKPPLHLFASAAHSGSPPAPAISELPDAEFISALHARFGSATAAIASDARTWSIYGPIIRADMAAIERDTTAADSLACGITAFVGLQDRVVGSDEGRNWQRWTRNRFDLRKLDVDHFSLRTAAALYLYEVESNLGPLRQAPSRSDP